MVIVIIVRNIFTIPLFGRLELSALAN